MSIKKRLMFICIDGLNGDSVASFLEEIQKNFAVRGLKINPHGHLIVISHGRLRSCVSVSKIVFSANTDKKRLSILVAILGEVPGIFYYVALGN